MISSLNCMKMKLQEINRVVKKTKIMSTQMMVKLIYIYLKKVKKIWRNKIRLKKKSRNRLNKRN